CDPKVMSDIEKNIGQFLKPKGQEQIQTGKKLYQQNGCSACHGSKGKVAAGMEGLEIPPRNFHNTKPENWYRSPNPLGIFLTLTNGARGQMRGYSDSLNPEQRWAIAHFILEKWVPDKYQTKTTQEDLKNLCRQRSQVPPPTPMTKWEDFQSAEESIQHAMDRLAADAPENREIRIEQYGDVKLSANADWKHGRRVYREQCASCHGSGKEVKFPGKTLGPAAVHRAPGRDRQPPTLYLDVPPLKRGHAGGTYRDFADRAMGGVHATMPEAASVTMLSKSDWKDLQAYIARADGDADVERMPPSKKHGSEKGADETDGSKESSSKTEGASSKTADGSTSDASSSDE
ncbi:MAG: c-type cytochrome, partial [Bradymonadaceae bacterium]